VPAERGRCQRAAGIGEQAIPAQRGARTQRLIRSPTVLRASRPWRSARARENATLVATVSVLEEMVTHLGMYVLAILAGMLVTAAALYLVKRPVEEDVKGRGGQRIA